MNVENRSDYIKYRYQRAKDTLEEAIILADANRWNAVVNRLYYSCFYALSALLLSKNVTTLTHDGVRTQFGLLFVKTDKVDRKHGRLFSKLFDYRKKGDYGDMFDFEKTLVEPLIEGGS